MSSSGRRFSIRKIVSVAMLTTLAALAPRAFADSVHLRIDRAANKVTAAVAEPERWRRREATGDMIIVRYADDIVVGFEHEHDARRFLDMMRTRIEEFRRSSGVANHVGDPDQDDGTDARDDDATDQAVGSRNAECAEEPSADETSDQTE